MLVRRLRETLKAKDIICVGTSATMGTGATFADVKRDVADVATRLFGAPVSEDDVIGERLRRITPDLRIDDPSVTEQLSIRVKDSGFDIPTTFDAFCKDPMASWVETTFGLEKENDTECVERMTVTFEPMELSRFRKRLRSAGSRPAVGSSTMMSLGLASSVLYHLAIMKGITNKTERNQMVDALLNQTNLWAARKKALSIYSGGMKQRFGIAQANSCGR